MSYHPPARDHAAQRSRRFALPRTAVTCIAASDIIACYLAPLVLVGFWPVIPLTAVLLATLLVLKVFGVPMGPDSEPRPLLPFLALWAIAAAFTGTVGQGAGWLVTTLAGVLAGIVVLARRWDTRSERL